MSTGESSSVVSFFKSITDYFSKVKEKEAAARENELNRLKFNISKEEVDEEIEKLTANETGWDRIKQLFSYDELLGRWPDYLTENYDLVTSVGIVGFFLGAIIKTQETKDTFHRNNQLTVYTNKKAATRAFVDYVYLQTLKGGARIAFRFIAFSGIMIGTSAVIQAYRCKSNPLDYTIGGILSGGLLRAHLGLYGFLAGSAVGGTFGTIFGVFRYGQLKLTETRYEDWRYNYLKDQIIQRKILIDAINESKQSKQS